LYARATEDRSNVVLVAVNLDPTAMHEARCYVPPEVVGVAAGERYHVVDVLTGARYEWGQDNYVRLDPERPCHILRVEKR
jgi:starch synthase (maltosyl-transferring)